MLSFKNLDTGFMKNVHLFNDELLSRICQIQRKEFDVRPVYWKMKSAL